jgi:hypothetical protein
MAGSLKADDVYDDLVPIDRWRLAGILQTMASDAEEDLADLLRAKRQLPGPTA